MGKKKDDMVGTGVYGPYLNGGRAYNPAMNDASATFHMYFNTLTELCANRFEWDGLPESINPRFLELQLFNYGLTVVYEEDKIGALIALQASAVGQMNYQGDPVEYTVIAPGVDNINKRVTIDDCVPVWANYLRRPELDKVVIYSKKLASIDRTIEINVENMRYTKVINVEEDQRTSYINMVRQHTEGQPLILGTRQLDMNSVQAFDVGVPPEAVPNLLVAKTKIWNECMSMLGINNANQEKRERLVADEVSANDAQVGAMQNIALNARQYAAKQISDKFNLNVTVDYRQKVVSDQETAELEQEQETPEKVEA